MKRTTTKLMAATSYAAIVGVVLAELRSRRQLTLADVASEVGLTESTISRIEHGASALTVTQLAQFSPVFDESPSSMLARADLAACRLRDRGVRVEREAITAAEAFERGFAWLGIHALRDLV